MTTLLKRFTITVILAAAAFVVFSAPAPAPAEKAVSGVEGTIDARISLPLGENGVRAGTVLGRLIAEDFFLPAEWAGIWQFQDTDFDCIANQQTDTGTSTDTLCTGDQIGFDDASGTFVFDCTGSVTTTTANIVCTGSIEIFPDCMQEWRFTLVANRMNDSMTASDTIEISYVGTGCAGIPFLEDSCERTDGIGTRTGPEPPDCGASPVEATTWGGIKGLYDQE